MFKPTPDRTTHPLFLVNWGKLYNDAIRGAMRKKKQIQKLKLQLQERVRPVAEVQRQLNPSTRVDLAGLRGSAVRASAGLGVRAIHR
jgi:hypothetical protein